VEYETDKLADYTNDEKRLCKAKKKRYSKKRRAMLDNGPVRNQLDPWMYSSDYQ